MPQAPAELRELMLEFFGGMDSHGPMHFLLSNGWKEKLGTLIPPGRRISDKEWDCVDFLVQEWDYGYSLGGAANL